MDKGGEAGFERANRALWLLVAAVPAIFALLTWDVSGNSQAWQRSARFFAWPVLAAESLAVLLAMRAGFSPLRAILAAPLWVRLTLGLLLLIAFGTALFAAPIPGLALTRTLILLLHLLFGLSAAFLIGRLDPDMRLWLWPALVAGLVLYAVILAIFVAAIPDPAGFPWWYFGLGGSHIRHVGYYMAPGAAAAIGLALTARNRPAYWLALLAATCLLTVSYWSGSRGSIAGVVGAFVLGMLISPLFRRGRAILTLLLANAGGAALSLIHLPPDPGYGLLRISRSAAAAGTGDITTGRTEIWAATFRMGLERPLFGFGEGQFRYLVPESRALFNHPHSFPVQLLFQWGIVGSICFLALAGFLLWQWLRLSRSSPEYAPAFLATASLLVFCLYDGTLYYSYPIMMVAIGLAYVLGAARGLKGDRAATASAANARYAPAAR